MSNRWRVKRKRRREERRMQRKVMCLKRRAYLAHGCCSALLAVAMAVYTTKQHQHKEGVTLAEGACKRAAPCNSAGTRGRTRW